MGDQARDEPRKIRKKANKGNSNRASKRRSVKRGEKHVTFNLQVLVYTLPESEAMDAWNSRFGQWGAAPYEDELWDGDLKQFRPRELTKEELKRVRFEARMKKTLPSTIFWVFSKYRKKIDTGGVVPSNPDDPSDVFSAEDLSGLDSYFQGVERLNRRPRIAPLQGAEEESSAKTKKVKRVPVKPHSGPKTYPYSILKKPGEKQAEYIEVSDDEDEDETESRESREESALSSFLGMFLNAIGWTTEVVEPGEEEEENEENEDDDGNMEEDYEDEERIHEEMEPHPNHGYGLDKVYEDADIDEVMDKLDTLDGVRNVPRGDMYARARSTLSRIQEAVGSIVFRTGVDAGNDDDNEEDY